MVDNRRGGGANIGEEIAAKSPPDGYTLFMVTGTHANGQDALNRLNSLNLVKDFAGIGARRHGHGGGGASVDTGEIGQGTRRVREIASRPDRDSSSGTGTVPQLAAEPSRA